MNNYELQQTNFLGEINENKLYNKTPRYDKFVNKLDTALQNGKGGVEYFWLSSMDDLANNELTILENIANRQGIYLNFQKGSIYASYLKKLKPNTNKIFVGFCQTQE